MNYVENNNKQKFLESVISILELPKDFTFKRLTFNTKVTVDEAMKNKLRALCAQDHNEREVYNANALTKRLNVNWSYTIMLNHFNIAF